MAGIPRYGAKITTVDPAHNKIGFVTKGDAQERTVEIYTTEPAFRWPRVGEDWIVTQKNGTWYLESLWPPRDTPVTFQDVNPGDLVLNTSSGTIRIMGSADGSTDTQIPTPQDAWVNLDYAPDWGNIDGFIPAQAVRDAMGFVHMRGMVTKAIPWGYLDLIGALPMGLRPFGIETFPCMVVDAVNGAFMTRLDIHPDGRLIMGGANTLKLQSRTFGGKGTFGVGDDAELGGDDDFGGDTTVTVYLPVQDSLQVLKGAVDFPTKHPGPIISLSLSGITFQQTN